MVVVALPSFSEQRDTEIERYLSSHLIGSITIPSIRAALPVFDVVNPTVLDYGAGVIEGTSYPAGGQKHTQCACGS